MTSVKLTSHVGADGILNLQIPTGIVNADLEVIVVVEAVASKPSEDLGWPPGFIEKFAGAIPDFPERAPQGEYEIRRELA